MKKSTLYLTLLTLVSLEANSLEKAFLEAEAETDGYLRGAYQTHNVKNDKRYNDNAVGAKLHIETKVIKGVSMGGSFYTSHKLADHENKGLVPFWGEGADSYSILGEAYVKVAFGKSMLKLGRQEIETPFAQTDDIGMIPNTFEAAVFVNTDIRDTTIFMAQIQKMAGVDAEVVDKFTRVNAKKNMQTLGVTYEGMNDLSLSAWYYNLSEGEIDKIAYVEGIYETSLNGIGYGLGLQYAKQSHSNGKTANILGATASLTFEKTGLTLATAYTQSDDNAGSSGFGGGPFFSNSEYLIIDNAGKAGTATWFGAELDAGVLGVEGLTLGLGKVTLENELKNKATEVDLVASYELRENLEMHMIYSDIDASNMGEDDAKHLRVFANYNF